MESNETYSAYDLEILLQQYSNFNMFTPDKKVYERDLLTYYIMGVGGMTLCCLGLVANMLSLVVLTQKTMRSSTYSYLSALAVCDSLMLLLTVILLMKDVNHPVKREPSWAWDQGIYPYLFPYIHPGAFTFQVTSVWLTLAFTVDRYIMICHPFKAEPLCSVSRARKVIFCLYVTAFIFNIPKFFEYSTVTIDLPMQNASITSWDLTELGRSHWFRELYHSWFYITFVCGVPFVTLAVLNGCLMQAVHLSRIRGKEINAAEKKRNDTTIMLISVVVVFFICQMPALVSRTIWAFEPDQKAFHQLPLYTLNEIGNLLIIMNSSINIVPYYFFGKKFRRNFWKIFCHCLLGYEKFQKFSRSLSLTVFEQHRLSQGGGNHSGYRERVGSREKYTETILRTPTSNEITVSKDSYGVKCTSGSRDSLLDTEKATSKPVNTVVNGTCINLNSEKVRRVGVTQPRYVSYAHLQPWLVHAFKNIKGRKAGEASDSSSAATSFSSFSSSSSKSEPQESEFILEDAYQEEDETVVIRVPDPPSMEQALEGERLPTPPEDKYKILSRIRSIVVERKVTSDTSSKKPGADKGTTGVTDKTPETTAKNKDGASASTTKEASAAGPKEAQGTKPGSDSKEKSEEEKSMPASPATSGSGTMKEKPSTLEPSAAEDEHQSQANADAESSVHPSGTGKVSGETPIPPATSPSSEPIRPPPPPVPTTPPTSTITAPITKVPPVPTTITTATVPRPPMFQPRGVRLRMPRPAQFAGPTFTAPGMFGPRIRLPVTPRQISGDTTSESEAESVTEEESLDTSFTEPGDVSLDVSTDADHETVANSSTEGGPDEATDDGPSPPETPEPEASHTPKTDESTDAVVNKIACITESDHSKSEKGGNDKSLESQDTAPGSNLILMAKGTSHKDESTNEEGNIPVTGQSSSSMIVKASTQREIPSISTSGGLTPSNEKDKSSTLVASDAETQASSNLRTSSEGQSSSKAKPIASPCASSEVQSSPKAKPIASPRASSEVQSSPKAKPIASPRASSEVQSSPKAKPIASPRTSSEVQSSPKAKPTTPVKPASKLPQSPRKPQQSLLRSPLLRSQLSRPRTVSATEFGAASQISFGVVQAGTEGDRSRTLSGSEVGGGAGGGAKLSRITSVLSPRSLPSLPASVGGRTRSMSESVSSSKADAHRTMVQLLENIAGSSPHGSKGKGQRRRAPSESQASYLGKTGGGGSSPRGTPSPRAKQINKAWASTSASLDGAEKSQIKGSMGNSSKSKGSRVGLSDDLIKAMLLEKDAPQNIRLRTVSGSSSGVSDGEGSERTPPRDRSNSFLSTKKATSPAILSALQMPIRFPSISGIVPLSIPKTPGMKSPPVIGSPTSPSFRSILPKPPNFTEVEASSDDDCNSLEPTDLDTKLAKARLKTKEIPQPGIKPQCEAGISDTKSKETKGKGKYSSSMKSDFPELHAQLEISRMKPKENLKSGSISKETKLALQRSLLGKKSSPVKSKSSREDSRDVIKGGPDNAISVPLKKLQGFENVKHLLGTDDPDKMIRINLPPGLKMPIANVPIKFSVISETEARRLGLPVPVTPSTSSSDLSKSSRGASQLHSSIHSESESEPLDLSTKKKRNVEAPPQSELDSHKPSSKERDEDMEQDNPSDLEEGEIVIKEEEEESDAEMIIKGEDNTSDIEEEDIMAKEDEDNNVETLPQVDGTIEDKDTKQSNVTENPGSNEGQEESGDADADADAEETPMDVTEETPTNTQTSEQQASTKAETEQESGNPAETISNPADTPKQMEKSRDNSSNVVEDDPSVTRKKTTEAKSKAERIARYSQFPKFKGRTPEDTQHGLYQRVLVVPRPWRQTDGTVNRPTLKLMLESVLILIMSRPGITYMDVTAQYNPILQPVPVLELLEMLEDIGCIRTVHIRRSHKCSAFSKRVEIFKVSEEGDPKLLKAFIPTVDCVLKLGQFEAQLTGGKNIDLSSNIDIQA